MHSNLQEKILGSSPYIMHIHTSRMTVCSSSVIDFKVANGRPYSLVDGFFLRDGLLYRLCTPLGFDDEMAIELVCPKPQSNIYLKSPMIFHYWVR